MNTLNTLCLLLLSAVFLLVPSTGFAAERGQVPILSVSGNGISQAEPDRATITLGVATHAKDAQDAQQENARKSSAVRDALLALGIAKNDIQTANYSFRPTYSRQSGHEEEISGYSVDNSVIVVVNDLSMIGKAIDSALHHGANEVSSLDFSLRDSSKARKEALNHAIKDAREKADIIAAGLGKHIVGIQSVTENTSSGAVRRYNGTFLAAKAEAAMADTAIESGMIDCSATVHIDFILSE